ncbi:hypothetical protein GCM10028803_34740 [Larkinella knui]|uniref:Outer membrane protein beta-barrel domain-containing protein n=1 Tax=Larkinella knui TaxID=2025310 RepID=A0A3P1CDE9_9BACT|nr:hypothetical protein [Larkinella knui]RRB11351.1 hypothetical protein EHT87_22955 [Larkinella knui]
MVLKNGCKIVGRALFGLGLLALLNTFTYAQDKAMTAKKEYNRYWVSAGFSLAYGEVVTSRSNVTTGNDQKKIGKYPGIMTSASFQPKRALSVISGRYVINAELFQDDSPGIKCSELGALYGVRLNGFIVSTGLSRVWGVDRGKKLSDPDPHGVISGGMYEKVTYAKLGVPIEVRYIFPLQWCSLGLTAFGNINEGHSFGGITFSIYGGKMQ